MCDVTMAEGGYTAGEWLSTAGVVVLIFAVSVAVVALIVGLFQRGQKSLTQTLLDPAVPITAVVLTVCCELIMHR